MLHQLRTHMSDSTRTSGPSYQRAAAFLAIAAAFALILATAATVSSADKSGLKLSVVATNKGPLGVGGMVAHFLYVTNSNQLTNDWAGTSRATLPNAFVVTSVDEMVFVDGVLDSSFTWSPPPDAFITAYSGRWPSTVVCEESEDENNPPLCDVVPSPAVLPGETAAVLYPGWGHGPGEPNGSYVFEFTVHGTLNGTPVELAGSSKAITMTD